MKGWRYLNSTILQAHTQTLITTQHQTTKMTGKTWAATKPEATTKICRQEYLYNDGIELHLPTGIKVGHRSLQRYYKQDLKPEVILTEGQGTLVAAETRSFLPAFDKKACRLNSVFGKLRGSTRKGSIEKCQVRQ